MPNTPWMRSGLAVCAALALSGCSLFTSPQSGPSPAGPAGAAGPSGAPGGAPGARRPGAPQGGPKEYDEVITEKAVTREGLFRTHRIGDDLFFEIPTGEFDREMMLIARAVESTLQNPAGFFGGGARVLVQWERYGDHVVLRERSYRLQADEDDNIFRQVRGFRNGPVIARLPVQAYNPADSAVVVDVTDLFLTFNQDMGSLQGTQKNRSWFEHVAAFPRNVEVEATQTGSTRPPGTPPNVPPSTQTVRMHWSMLKLPDDPMMARYGDDRVGFISTSYYDFSSREHESELKRIIHRFKLEPSDTAAFRRGELVEPVEPIVYWIDPATPEWMKPWVKVGVEKWNTAFEEAGFRNAIRGEYAPEDDPDWSIYDLRRSIIYWRPSTVANATGGQIVDPRSGQILKGEVNMYHNIMDLQRRWYFVQVSPLDERAQRLPLPDSLMGRLVEYVVTHEVGHSIGFPHNMKASAMYPADSIRSRPFLERMGGHVATLMDYSRFNYAAQPEDNIPPELLIPQVGPYDKFAVKWGYRPILEADSPEAERTILDGWAREQDDTPWFRFSTSDAPNDPENLTEAVGDADAVKSTTLGLRNLGRVMDNLLAATETPGEDYSLTENMYGEAVGQWGRYMRHVAALIGGAITQEKLGTGPRFEPVPEARQREAMTFLTENAFQVPAMLLDRDVLWRIEARGAVDRIRDAQTSLFGTLLQPAKLNTLVEYEALTGGNTYTLGEYMADMREALWSELDDGSVRVNIYRRNLQRAFLDRVDAELNPTERQLQQEEAIARFLPRPPRWGTDVRAMLRAELRAIDRMAQNALGRAGDAMTRVHLEDVRAEVARILEGTR
ncbi:MAG: zinc-dependent metalloprotease [Longimicrobiales bacterium]|nr:zinc-dependent metalloprotease [Longimicrobiales bacterium]